jgi:hypothetical protein
VSRLEVKRWQGRAADLYDVLTEVVNAGGLNQLPVGLVTRAMDQLTAYAVDVAIERAQQETDDA